MTPGFILVLSIAIQLIFGHSVNEFLPNFRYTEFYHYIYLTVSSLLSIFLPSYLYIKHNKKNYFSEFFSDIKFDILLPISVSIGIFSQFAGIIANLPANILIDLYGGNIQSVIPGQSSFFELFLSVFCFALVPAVSEEILFRGIVLNHYRRYGNKAAIIISSILFGIMHFSIGNLLAPLMMGIVFGILYVNTNNIIYPILAHFSLNGVSCIVTFLTRHPVIKQLYGSILPILLLISVPLLIYLVRFFILHAKPVKTEEFNVTENKTAAAFKSLLISPTFYILIVIYAFIGGSSL